MPYFFIRDYFEFVDITSELNNATLLDNLLNKERKQENGKIRNMFKSTNDAGHRGRQGKIVRRSSQTRRG